MTLTWPSQTFKQRFEAGWTKYVKPDLGFPPKEAPPDMYWDPRKGDWYLYSTATNDIQDKGWPKVDISGFFAVPGTTYEHIVQQYLTLPLAEQPRACWDPRRAQWMRVSGREAGPPPGKETKAQALRRFISQIDDLYQDGHIGVAVKDEIERLIQGEM